MNKLFDHFTGRYSYQLKNGIVESKNENTYPAETLRFDSDVCCTFVY